MNACLSGAVVSYIDGDFEHMKFDPDDMDAKIPKKDALDLTKPADFDDSNIHEHVDK